MNWGQLLLILAIPFIIAGGYFYFIEDTGVKFFQTSPQAFVEETLDLIAPGPESNEFTEATDFLQELEPVADEQTEPAPEVTPVANAEYQVTFSGTWSRESHGAFYTDAAHFSPFVAWSHIKEALVFTAGGQATPGMEKMAELGGTNTLEAELAQKESIQNVSVGQRFDSPGSSQNTIVVTPEFPYLSVVSMIAPSPDWFISAKDVLLFEDGGFVDSVTLDVVSYDAGTEEGSGFSIENNATSPHSPISGLTDIPADTLPVFGTVTITRIK